MEPSQQLFRVDRCVALFLANVLLTVLFHQYPINNNCTVTSLKRQPRPEESHQIATKFHALTD